MYEDIFAVVQLVELKNNVVFPQEIKYKMVISSGAAKLIT